MKGKHFKVNEQELFPWGYKGTCQAWQPVQLCNMRCLPSKDLSDLQALRSSSAFPETECFCYAHAGMVQRIAPVPVTSNCVKVDTPDWMGAKRPASLREMSGEGDWMEQVPPLVALAMAP